MTDTAPELKPCPFCGGEPSANGSTKYSKGHEAWWPDGSQILRSYCVNCMECGISNTGAFGHQTKELAVVHWNTRADIHDALKAENERLREYAVEATKALTGLTVGGSEFFKGEKLGFFEADILACVKNVKWRMDAARRLGESRGRAEGIHVREGVKVKPLEWRMVEGGYECTNYRFPYFLEWEGSAYIPRLNRGGGRVGDGFGNAPIGGLDFVRGLCQADHDFTIRDALQGGE